jgi:hypothetical protein
MELIRFKGLVRVAQRLRDQLDRPITEPQLSEIRRWVKNSLAVVEQTLAKREANAANVARPSRRAYEFLRQLDAEGYPHHSASALGVPAAEPLRFPRLEWLWRHTLRCMAVNRAAYDDETHAALCGLSAEIERSISSTDASMPWLDGQTQAIRGWLRYFARRERFDAYRAAVARARGPVLEAIHRRWPDAGSWICFQPVRGLLRLHEKNGRVRLILPTPAFLFDERGFGLIARVALADGERRALQFALQAPECQAVQAELDALGVEGLAGPVAPV